MLFDALADLIRDSLEEGQQLLALHLRTLIYKTARDWFERLPFEDDTAFLRPTLFAWFTGNDPDLTLAQLICGHLPAEQRPSSTPVRSDRKGRVFLPGLGTFLTEHPMSSGEWIQDGKRGILRLGNHYALATFQPEMRLDAHELAIYTQIPAVFEHFFPQPPLAGVEENTRFPIHELNVALLDLRHLDPLLYAAIRQVTSSIQLYRSEAPNSFASLSAHGAAFLNVPPDADRISFLDDIAHQCGHILFNAMTLQRQATLAIEPETPLRAIVPAVGDTRSVYSAFHGLFTYSLILRSLDARLNAPGLSLGERFQTRGRIAFYLTKFHTDLCNLNHARVFTPLGQLYYARFLQTYEAAYARYANSLKDLDLSQQPYVFSWSQFLQDNPVSRTLRSAGATSSLAALG